MLKHRPEGLVEYIISLRLKDPKKYSYRAIVRECRKKYGPECTSFRHVREVIEKYNTAKYINDIEKN